MEKKKMIEGFFLDRENYLHREATTRKDGRLISSNGERLKDKTELVKNTAIELEDGDWLINDAGVRRSGLWFKASEPIAEANMHHLYDGVLCAPVKRSEFPAKDGNQCWEFCSLYEGSHLLLKERWEIHSDDPKKNQETILEKYGKKTDYIRMTSSKAENSGNIWVLLKKELVNEDLLM